jgi:hypothetical protein
MHYHLIGMNKNATWFVINLLNEGLQHSTSPCCKINDHIGAHVNPTIKD